MQTKPILTELRVTLSTDTSHRNFFSEKSDLLGTSKKKRNRTNYEYYRRALPFPDFDADKEKLRQVYFVVRTN